MVCRRLAGGGDAAAGVRAECVMLNNGLYLVQAVRALDDILKRMEGHQQKSRSTLRKLRLAELGLRSRTCPGLMGNSGTRVPRQGGCSFTIRDHRIYSVPHLTANGSSRRDASTGRHDCRRSSRRS